MIQHQSYYKDQDEKMESDINIGAVTYYDKVAKILL